MWGWLIIPVLVLSMAVGGPLPIVEQHFDASGNEIKDLSLPYAYARHIHDNSTIGNGLAYLGGTTWGRIDAGRTVIVGHGNRAFADLHTLHIGDEIALLMNSYETLHFEVVAIYWTTPGDTSILTEPSVDYELVLMTCSSDESHRLIVRAKLIETYR